MYQKIGKTALSVLFFLVAFGLICLYELWDRGYFTDNSDLVEIIENTDFRDQLVQLASKERGDYLEESEILNVLATTRAKYLCEHPFEHDGWEESFKDLNYQARGENIAQNYGIRFDESETVHQAFMDSPEHRANILNPAYKFMGIGRAPCVMFGEPGDTNEWGSADITVELFAG